MSQRVEANLRVKMAKPQQITEMDCRIKYDTPTQTYIVLAREEEFWPSRVFLLNR